VTLLIEVAADRITVDEYKARVIATAMARAREVGQLGLIAAPTA
jgi:hypothetical protein